METTCAAYEAVQRYKAMVCKKFETQNKVRLLRNESLQRAQSDAQLLKLEDFAKQVDGLG